MRTDGASDVSMLREYARVLRRRKWVALFLLATVTAAAVAISVRQQALYQASAKVVISRENLAAILTGASDTNNQQPERISQTQAELATQPRIAARVLEALGLNRTPADLLAHTDVSGEPNADLLVFRVMDPSPLLARRLANEYAQQFVRYRRELDTTSLVRARDELLSRLQELRQEGRRKSQAYAELLQQSEQLRTMELLRQANVVPVDSAASATKVQPHPLRNGLLGFLLGLLLGVGAAFLWDALDTRVRSAQEIGDRLGLPLLARLSKPPRRLRRRNRLSGLEKPSSVQAEAFRVLRTNLNFANFDKGAQLIMVTSGVEGEGKSTTVANLAVTYARAGQRVVLVDLDLQRPYLHRFFGPAGSPGLREVVSGDVALEEALVEVPLQAEVLNGKTDADPRASPGKLEPVAVEAASKERLQSERPSVLEELAGMRHQGSTAQIKSPVRSEVMLSRASNPNGSAATAGRLEVLPSGPVPPNPGEFLELPGVGQVLEALRERAELVFVDAAPLLHVGDTIALSAQVDALFLVVRLDTLRQPTLIELRRVLGACRTSKLGFAVTWAKTGAEYDFAGSDQYVGRVADA